MGSNPSKNYSQHNEIDSYNISSYPFFTQICTECKKMASSIQHKIIKFKMDYVTFIKKIFSVMKYRKY